MTNLSEIMERYSPQFSSMNLLPRDEKFFDLFHRHVEILCQSSELLLYGLRNGYSGMCSISKRMEALERNADDIVHLLFQRLQTTFITPFDPEDIQTLATTLDSVLDAIEDATFRIACYRIDPIPQAAVQLGQMIDNCCKALARALNALNEKKSVLEERDHLRHKGTAALEGLAQSLRLGQIIIDVSLDRPVEN